MKFLQAADFDILRVLLAFNRCGCARNRRVVDNAELRKRRLTDLTRVADLGTGFVSRRETAL